MKYSIGQFGKMINISSYTLRYYEKEDLIHVKRDENGRRYYEDVDLNWISFIVRLKDTGMQIKDIKKFADLRYQGEITLKERLAILQKHRNTVVAEIEKWNENLANLDEKIVQYEDLISKQSILLT